MIAVTVAGKKVAAGRLSGERLATLRPDSTTFKG